MFFKSGLRHIGRSLKMYYFFGKLSQLLNIIHANGLSEARNKEGSTSILSSLYSFQGHDLMGHSVIIN